MTDHDRTPNPHHRPTQRFEPMALLIPDARRSLLGGLIDDGALLCSSPPTVEQAVDSYQQLKLTENGWMVGGLVVPASHLEELASVLVRTLRTGAASVPIVTTFDGETASDASMAAAVHTMLDPAARIERVLLPLHGPDPVDGVSGAVAAGNGIHHGVLSMTAVPLDMPHGDTMDAISAAGNEALRPAGAWIDLSLDAADPASLASVIRESVGSFVPFTVLSNHLPAITQVDRPSGKRRYGVLNLLAATFSAESAESDVAAVLADDNPQTYTIEFGGLTRTGEGIRSSGSVGADRSPLVSLTTLDAADTIAALGALNHSS